MAAMYDKNHSWFLKLLTHYSPSHVIHCLALVLFILFLEIVVGPGVLPLEGSFNVDYNEHEPAWDKYGPKVGGLFILLRASSLISIPAMIFHFIGLTLYESFRFDIRLKISPLIAPFICIRIVTKGDYPQLVRENVEYNLSICLNSGLRNFIIEVVTDKTIHLAAQPHIREIVVPFAYETTTRAKYKARALQYCLEPEVNLLSGDDWIVHLDEESLLTEGSVRGILNFVCEDKAAIGQGMITYASGKIVNWWTTVADSFRVAADLGAVRAAHRIFARALFIFKGSFVVTRYSVESLVTFDNGAEGSIAEDTFFAMKAVGMGFSFGWVEGEVQEMSPFTFYDFFMQRKRWLQGLYHVVHSTKIPLKARVCLGFSFYTWFFLPLTLLNGAVSLFFRVTLGPFLDYLLCFSMGVGLYMYVFGAIRSFNLSRMSVINRALCVAGAIVVIPVTTVVEAFIAVFGLFGDKLSFYVVTKEIHPRRDDFTI